MDMSGDARSEPDSWVTIQEAADHLRVSTKTIRRRIADGTLTAKRFGPRLIRVPVSELNKAGTQMHPERD